MTDTRVGGVGAKVLRKTAPVDTRVGGVGFKVLRKTAPVDTRVGGVGFKVLLGSRVVTPPPTVATLKASTDGVSYGTATMKIWDAGTSTWIAYPAFVNQSGTWVGFQ